MLGLIVGVCGLGIYHFSEMKRIRQEQVEDDKRFSGLVASTKDIIYYFEKKPGFQFRYVLPPLEHFVGEEMGKEAFVDPQKFFYLVHPDDLEMLWKKIKGEVDYNKPIVNRISDRKGGYTCYEEYTTPVYKDGEIVALQGILRNINEKIKLQAELEYRINHDDLTGLYNRGYFEKKLFKYNHEVNAPVAIIMCDLDELKYVNDHYGHNAGDLLIKTTANILNDFSCEQTVIARMGGDEFALIVTDASEEIVIKMVVSEINSKMNDNVIESLNLPIKLSIGYAYRAESIHQMEEIFSEADKDMYRNKNRRKRVPVLK
ncbi:sensor domain-containing diguanylate cyclase [Mesobacillus stamsii]|uniref:Diguanylate cyclase (GGDEF)-like protein n=1 Tax=Mesobacillus stamsii TaxID=225347 RepID=A0ABU0G070_9BACI|nr:diguanylate cyclase [Mesobacillus stamsii]MDQ0414984.1 diguanylate cyclase (GGDEF)-like protein [Mesobacillus stamsii]